MSGEQDSTVSIELWVPDDCRSMKECTANPRKITENDEGHESIWFDFCPALRKVQRSIFPLHEQQFYLRFPEVPKPCSFMNM